MPRRCPPGTKRDLQAMEPTSNAPLVVSDVDGVRVLRLNRPDKLNALNHELTTALVAALRHSEAAPEISAVVLTGAGRSFCAGADTKELGELSDAESATRHAEIASEMHQAFSATDLPTIAAVEGHALGGGCGLALACDFVIAATGAEFGYPEMGRGVLPALVLPNLVRIAGSRLAFELVSTGQRLDAARAMDLRLINRVVDKGEALEDALQLARTLATLDRRLVSRLKRLLKVIEPLPLDQAIDKAAEANAQSRLEGLGEFPQTPSPS